MRLECKEHTKVANDRGNTWEKHSSIRSGGPEKKEKHDGWTSKGTKKEKAPPAKTGS